MSLLNLSNKKNYFFNTDDAISSYDFSDILYYLLQEKASFTQPIIFLCIGTDRATGDSLGPLIGYKLKKMNLKNIHIYGTLDEPVHAKNIEDTVDQIYKCFRNPFIVAIDACLGKMDHIGYVNIGEGSIKPGAGVNKKLPSVGNVYIKGIVNFSGFMDMLILQNTRLNTVMKIADFITSGIIQTYSRLELNLIKADRISPTYHAKSSV